MMGIYCIEDSAGRVYYGSSKNIKKRITAHKYNLRKGTHTNKKLQAVWNKHGAAYFSFYCVEVITDESTLLTKEQAWLDFTFQTLNDFYRYNTAQCAAAPTRGLKQSAETIALRVEKLRGQKRTDDVKVILSVIAKNRAPNPDARAKMAATKTGVKQKQETIDKRVSKTRGKSRTNESKLKYALARSGGKVYTFMDSSGKEYDNIISLTEFAETHNLDSSTLSAMVRGKVKTHRGFKFVSFQILKQYLDN